jgi:hypothetical protein
MPPEFLSKQSESHNTRYEKHTDAINTVVYSDSDRVRFAAKVDRRGDHECWFWASQIQPNGYGMFKVGHRSASPKYAHRVSYEMTHGPIADGAHVLHRCDQRNCVNPAHLFLGTHTDNMRDASAKGRLAVARVANRERIAEIQRRWLAGGVTQRALAAEYGVHPVQIGRWLKAVKQHPHERRSA